MGKTRTALQLAEHSLDHFADGVWWVELEETCLPAEMIQRIAQALSVDVQEFYSERKVQEVERKWAASLGPKHAAMMLADKLSAVPLFDITTGRDLYGTTLFNTRPGIASDPSKPGVIRTAFHDSMPPAVKENNLKNRIPLHREGTSEQVASLIREMTQNDYITGETYTIDGGLTMRIC